MHVVSSLKTRFGGFFYGAFVGRISAAPSGRFSRMLPLTPALSLKGEGAVSAGNIWWGSLSPKGEGVQIAQNLTLKWSTHYRYPYRVNLLALERPPKMNKHD
jgi:hypothetical protein